MTTKVKPKKQSAKRNGTSLSALDNLAEEIERAKTRIFACEAIDEQRRRTIERDEAHIRALVCVLKSAVKERWNPLSSWTNEARELLKDPELYYI